MPSRLYTLLSMLAATAMVKAGIEGPVGGASGSCSYYGIESDGHTLAAVCYQGDGNQVISFLDLNHCLANYGGWLNYALDGGAFGSCYGASVSNNLLYANCYTADGVVENNVVGLDSFVGNLNGQLSC